MKNKTFKFALLMAFVGGFFISCDEEETVANTLSFPGDAFVAFVESGSTVAESAGMVTITAQYASTNSTVDQSFAFTSASEEAVEGVDYEIVDSRTSFDFAAGVHINSIDVNIIDNLNVDGTKNIVFTLTGQGFPGEGAINSTYTLVVSDDDCPFLPSDFTGGPATTETYNSNGPYTDGFNFSLLSSTDDGAGTFLTATYEVSGLIAGQLGAWGEVITDGGTLNMTLDNTDPTAPVITITGAADPQGSGFLNYYCTSDEEWVYYTTIDGTANNSFSTCGKSIDFSYIIDIFQISTGASYAGDGYSVASLQF
jgi:hypothetical protein